MATKISTPVASFTFKPKQAARKLLAALPERARDVIVSRYGLGDSSKKMTLEAIGKKYGVTRERVRQIENYALMSIRKSGAYQKERPVFTEMEQIIHGLGGIIAEEE